MNHKFNQHQQQRWLDSLIVSVVFIEWNRNLNISTLIRSTVHHHQRPTRLFCRPTWQWESEMKKSGEKIKNVNRLDVADQWSKVEANFCSACFFTLWIYNLLPTLSMGDFSVYSLLNPPRYVRRSTIIYCRIRRFFLQTQKIQFRQAMMRKIQLSKLNYGSRKTIKKSRRITEFSA